MQLEVNEMKMSQMKRGCNYKISKIAEEKKIKTAVHPRLSHS